MNRRWACGSNTVEEVARGAHAGGVLFAGTVLGLEASHTRSARALLVTANKQGGVENREDTGEGLRGILDESLQDVEIEVAGSAALFAAAVPRA